MASVVISNVAVAHPAHWTEQADAARRIGLAIGDERRVAAIARGTQIRRRATVLPAEEIAALGSIEARNAVYQDAAPQLALEVATEVIGGSQKAAISHLIASSCTGYMIPGWDVQLAQQLCLEPYTKRLPLTESGCAGGVIALARGADYLGSSPEQETLVVAVELCSLAFHAQPEAGNLISALLFADGAGAARLRSTTHVTESDLEIVDSLSYLVPDSQQALGFALTDRGFYPILTRQLTDLLPAPTREAAMRLLVHHNLSLDNVGFWLVHPGGARILSGLANCLNLDGAGLRWSWDSMRSYGNMSSASIFDVIRRYLEDESAPRGWGIVAGFGPGVSIELLLVHRA